MSQRTDLPLESLRTPISGDKTLAQIIDALTVEGQLYTRLDNNFVYCHACEHNCKIPAGGRGVCQVRYNLNGKLYAPWGYVGALQCDPIEKKPFFHVLPSANILTFGMLGCDLHCAYCQNWDISQSLRDAKAGRPPTRIEPKQLIELALKNGARAIASSYNEPLITSEWAAAIFEEAKKHNLLCIYVSNGNASEAVLDFIKPYLNAYKIDLKTMRDKSYRSLGTSLNNILNGIKMVHVRGIWLEIVTLLIPGFNDSEDEIKDAAQFIKSVSANIPWHITAFHKDYRMTDPENTSAQTLIKATEIAYNEGLNFVYPGNLPGRVGHYEHTFCPKCKFVLIKRLGYVILEYNLINNNHCPNCASEVPGIWPIAAEQVKLGTVQDLHKRVPKAFKLS